MKKATEGLRDWGATKGGMADGRWLTRGWLGLSEACPREKVTQ